jgi:hypothetical protein
LFDVMLVSPKATIRAANKTSSGFFIDSM